MRLVRVYHLISTVEILHSVIRNLQILQLILILSAMSQIHSIFKVVLYFEEVVFLLGGEEGKYKADEGYY